MYRTSKSEWDRRIFAVIHINKVTKLCSEYSEMRARLRSVCGPSFTSSCQRCDVIRPPSRSIICREKVVSLCEKRILLNKECLFAVHL